MNQVVLIGRLTKDPELRFTAGSGKAVHGGKQEGKNIGIPEIE